MLSRVVVFIVLSQLNRQGATIVVGVNVEDEENNKPRSRSARGINE